MTIMKKHRYIITIETETEREEIVFGIFEDIKKTLDTYKRNQWITAASINLIQRKSINARKNNRKM